MARSRRRLASLTGRGSLLRDLRALCLVAALLACALAVQVGARLARPDLPERSLDPRALGEQGGAERDRLSDALCVVDLGVEMGDVDRVRAEVSAEIQRFAESEGLGRQTRVRLVGLGESLLGRYDFARLYYDMALVSEQTASWRLARERERGLAAATTLVDGEQARRFESAVFQIWDMAWCDFERGMNGLEGGAPLQPLTELHSTEPVLGAPRLHPVSSAAH